MDNLTEELEENPESTVYDDYKFVTRKDLENLGKTVIFGSLADFLVQFLNIYTSDFCNFGVMYEDIRNLLTVISSSFLDY